MWAEGRRAQFCPTHGAWPLNSGGQTWHPVPLPTKLSPLPAITFSREIKHYRICRELTIMQDYDCGSLNVVGHNNFIGVALLGGVALLEEVCHRGGGL